MPKVSGRSIFCNQFYIIKTEHVAEFIAKSYGRVGGVVDSRVAEAYYRDQYRT